MTDVNELKKLVLRYGFVGAAELDEALAALPPGEDPLRRLVESELLTERQAAVLSRRLAAASAPAVETETGEVRPAPAVEVETGEVRPAPEPEPAETDADATADYYTGTTEILDMSRNTKGSDNIKKPLTLFHSYDLGGRFANFHHNDRQQAILPVKPTDGHRDSFRILVCSQNNKLPCLSSADKFGYFDPEQSNLRAKILLENYFIQCLPPLPKKSTPIFYINGHNLHFNHTTNLLSNFTKTVEE